MAAAELSAQRAHPSRSEGTVGNVLRIALVTDQPLYREGMQLAFGEAGSLILLEGATIADAARLVKSRLADIVVIEANSIPQAVAMAKTLASCPATVPIVAVSASARVEEVRYALDAGMRGCVLKRVQGQEFARILESISQGAYYVPPELGAGLIRKNLASDRSGNGELRPYKLTAREQQILDCVARALSNKEIARELQISEKTVKHYMTVIMQKLQVRNRVEAVLKLRSKHAAAGPS